MSMNVVIFWRANIPVYDSFDVVIQIWLSLQEHKEHPELNVYIIN
jgi:hypothetical protein